MNSVCNHWNIQILVSQEFLNLKLKLKRITEQLNICSVDCYSKNSSNICTGLWCHKNGCQMWPTECRTRPLQSEHYVRSVRVRSLLTRWQSCWTWLSLYLKQNSRQIWLSWWRRHYLQARDSLVYGSAVRSDVWEFFDKVGNSQGKCRLCSKLLWHGETSSRC